MRLIALCCLLSVKAFAADPSTPGICRAQLWCDDRRRCRRRPPFQGCGIRSGTSRHSALRNIEPLDAIHYVSSLAPTALLFQSAQLDPGVTDEQAQALFDAASDPKALKWYDTAHHVLDIAAISDRARFLASHLMLKRIDPILKFSAWSLRVAGNRACRRPFRPASNKHSHSSEVVLPA
jgi:hypothetical protein